MTSRFFPLDDGYLQSVQNADNLPPLPSDEEGDIHNLKHRVSCPRNHPDTSYYVSKGFQRKKTNQTTYSNLKPRNICFYVYFAPTLPKSTCCPEGSTFNSDIYLLYSTILSKRFSIPQ